MTLGEKIKAKRKQDRLSAPDLGAKLGLNYNNIYKWEKGSTPSNPEEYAKIDRWLNNLENVPHETTINDLEQEYGNKNPRPSARDQELEDKMTIIDLLKKRIEFLEQTVQANFAESMKNQLILAAKVDIALHDLSRIRASLEKKKASELLDIQRREIASHYERMLKTGIQIDGHN